MFYSKLLRPRILFKITREEEEDVKPSSRMYGGKCFNPHYLKTLQAFLTCEDQPWLTPFWISEIMSFEHFTQKTQFEFLTVAFIWLISLFESYVTCTLRGLLIQMQSISLRSTDMRRKLNIEIFFGFTSDIAVLTFTFRFLSSPLFSLSLPLFFLLLGI